eukprot:gene4053-4604_t
MELLQVSIESGLDEISNENLEGLATFLDIEGIERLTRLQIIRKVRREIENQVQTLEEQDKSEENTMKYLQDIKTFIEITSPTLEPEEIEATETVQDSLAEAKIELDIMQREFQRMLALQEEKLKEAKEKMEQLNKDCLPSKPFKTKPQEFRGYSESEIVDAVINAISPCLHLKSYLESIKKLSLEQLRQTLRSQYCEETASEIYRELTNVVQEPSETLLSFLMRALKLCQQIIIASEENNSKIKYEESSINSVFLHTVETGLADENIRTRLRPFLLETDVSDEVLIREINVAKTSEHEPQGKLAPRKLILKTNSPASVSAVTAAEENLRWTARVNKTRRNRTLSAHSLKL